MLDLEQAIRERAYSFGPRTAVRKDRPILIGSKPGGKC